ncbi:thermonuclease family protein [Roseibium sp.]|uniref:thermonuclease family protein n=1 Tax=Roseibium sp. TaxID=1936156 RepID=UPI003918D438
MFLRPFFLLLALMVSTGAHAAVVVDGDTIDIDGQKYRLNGIDAPEYGQKCNRANGKTWSCGKKSTEALKALLDGKNPDCKGHERDSYNRIIATCYVGDLDLNRELVRAGLAWAFVRYDDIYAEEEANARRKGIGIWQAETQAPWDFRAERWAVAAQEAPEGCPIKGNISKKTKERIYHAPWSPWYKRTKITLSDGERWFCDEAEATAAGWRAPYWGR